MPDNTCGCAHEIIRWIGWACVAYCAYMPVSVLVWLAWEFFKSNFLEKGTDGPDSSH